MAAPAPRNVFIDCGAHRGESIEHFRRTRTYREHDWEMHCFEASPRLCAEIPRRWDLDVHPQAVWVHDEGVDLFVGAGGRSAGNSVIASKRTAALDKDHPLRVPSMDLGRWILSSFDRRDHLVLKMDIEGAEYEVLRKMIRDGSIEYVDRLFIEYHASKTDIPQAVEDELRRRLAEYPIAVVGESQKAPEDRGDWFQTLDEGSGPQPHPRDPRPWRRLARRARASLTWAR